MIKCPSNAVIVQSEMTLAIKPTLYKLQKHSGDTSVMVQVPQREPSFNLDSFKSLLAYLSRCSLQILVLELNDEAAEQTVEAKIVDLLQGQEGFRWKVMVKYVLCAIFF